MAPSEPPEAPLAPEEIGQASALVAEAGWNQIAADWELFVSAGRVHAVRDGGRVIATAATLPYQGFGWISMVLVAGTHRRRGLATRLLARCIDELSGAGLVPVLDATPAGQPLYKQLGFQDSWEITRLIARDHSTTPPPCDRPADLEIRPLQDNDWPELLGRDRHVFGADRRYVLAQLRQRLPAAAWGAFAGERLKGYVFGRDGRTASHLGPLVADDEEIAKTLLSQALTCVAGPTYIDLLSERRSVRTWLEGAGFTAERTLTRMLLGRSAAFDDRGSLVAIAGPELG